MLKRLLPIVLLAGMLSPLLSWAQQRGTEGMWMPLYAKDLNYTDMSAMGFKLGPDGVYSEKEQSLKDVIVRLNGGMCTAEVISDKGLLLTNHHCGYDAVASLSSVEHDYLTDGFWAKNHGEELPIAGGFVSFLVKMENVTDIILGKEKIEIDQNEIETRKQKLIARTKEGNDYSVEVKEMFGGSEFYLFIYEDFRDIRMVAAPPSSIGKFGGDTDNWMWPRHTGDFSLMRIYADKNNKPTKEYSKENVPYRPKKHLPISIKGINDGDYTMIMGYPGSTDRYLTAKQMATDTA
jgi:hypothetical protein